MVDQFREAIRSLSLPTRRSDTVFAAKVAIHRLFRSIQDLVALPSRFAKSERTDFPVILTELRLPLWGDDDKAEQEMQIGKVQNLRMAARALDGVVIPKDGLFSFWRHVGPPLRIRGYVAGRMLREGCMVPATGGGLCQLSNALYDVALTTDCHIVERHAHSRIVPGSAAGVGRDATVAWNYVDLRFIPNRDVRLSVTLTADSLLVRLSARPSNDGCVAHQPRPAEQTVRLPRARSCGSCGETACSRHETPKDGTIGARAVLVDEAWPELKAYVKNTQRSDDRLGIPLNGRLLNLRRYSWDAAAYRTAKAAPAATLRRALSIRRAPSQGQARRTAELIGSDRIAHSLSRLLTPDVTEVVVAQSYLPFLWRQGHLGGRRVTVLMTRLPIGVLQSRLDQAAARYPNRKTLSDFRAEAWRVEAEAEALANADLIVTPHAEIMSLFAGRALQLPWDRRGRVAGQTAQLRRILFPGPTLARKGAYEVRAVARDMDLEVVLLGAELEGASFWDETRIVRTDSWESVAAVVQPALVEDQPRRLLAALAAGIPVIATTACGLEPQPGLTLVPSDDVDALKDAVCDSLRMNSALTPAVPPLPPR